MNNEWHLIELDDLGVLRLRGADGVRFLQGQVSNDVERVTAERSLIAGYHNPQGRAIALLRLVRLAPDDVLAIVPRELAATVAGRLGKFVLRAKVKIGDESGGWRVAGLVAPHVGGGVGADGGVDVGDLGASGAGSLSARGSSDGSDASSAGGRGSTGESAAGEQAAAFEARAASWAAAVFEEARARVAQAGEHRAAAVQLEDADSVVELPTASALMLPDEVNAQSRAESTIIVRVGATPARWLVISPADEAPPLSGCVAAGRDTWRLLDISEGIPQVYAATSEEFVAQMLNLDALGGISFEKGCYTGQEVIARAHYRGRVKRRLQRFMSRGPAKLAIGESGQLADGRAFKVVEAVQLSDGRCEFLAVAPLAGAPLEAAAGTVSTAAVATGSAAAAVTLEVEPLPLSYSLPD